MKLSDQIRDDFFQFQGKDFYNSSFNLKWFSDLNIEPRVIFDVGSYDFGDSIRFKQEFNNIEVFAFEADPERYDSFYKYANDIGIITENKALYKDNGKISFYQSSILNTDENNFYEDNKRSGQGSIYKHTNNCKKIHPHIKQEEYPIDVNCIRIDEYCYLNNIFSIDLAHIDVEGAEMDVIEGMGNIRPKLLYIETQRDFFLNTSSIENIHDRLLDMGYELILDLISDRFYILK